jgi:replicative DNA helicase
MPEVKAKPAPPPKASSMRRMVATDGRAGRYTRALAYVMAPGFPGAVGGQHGHGVLYRVACVFWDEFGCTEAETLQGLHEFNRTKSDPPEDDKQIEHKVRSAIGKHPIPSLRLLNADRPGFEGRGKAPGNEAANNGRHATAGANGDGKKARVEEEDEEEETFDLGILGATAFLELDYPQRWIVEGIWALGRPGIVAGPKKTLKTSVVVDMVISIATATDFLRRFRVTQRRRVLLLSGESGTATLQDCIRRVCKAHDIEPAELEGWAFFGETLPRLDHAAHLQALAEYIEEHEIEVVFLDPLYLCLLSSGNTRLDPANMFDIGPLLKLINDTIREAGATPLLIHHFKKGREDPFAPPEMDDVAYAGVTEFARQWVLLGRRKRYEPGSGLHELWLSAGGSDGQGGAWAVDIDEGIIDLAFRGRHWKVSVTSPTEARTELRDQVQQERADRDRQKEAEKDAKLLRDCEEAWITLETMGPTTEKQWRDRLNKGGDKIGPIRERLLADGRIVEANVEVPCGKQGGTKTVPGWAIVHTGTHRDRTGTTPGSPGVGPGKGTPGLPGETHTPSGGVCPPVSRCVPGGPVPPLESRKEPTPGRTPVSRCDPPADPAATAWLAEHLAARDRDAMETLRHADRAGFTVDQIQAAAEVLGVERSWPPGGGERWRLAPSNASSEGGTHHEA